MAPRAYADRAPAYTGTFCNWIAFILLIFSVASPWWSWGVTYGPIFYPPDGYVSTSIGPWNAGRVYDTVTYTYCYFGCFTVPIGYGSVLWNELTDIEVCPPNNVNTTTNILNWSGPQGLDMCSGPDDDRKFHRPSKLKGIQATIVLGVIFCFFAAILGCLDSDRGFPLSPLLTSILSWIGAIFTLTSLSLWASWNYVDKISYTDTGFYMPVRSSNGLVAIVTSMSWGPAFATVIAAFILQFFASLFHTVTIFVPREEDVTAYRRTTPPHGTTNTTPFTSNVAGVPPAQTGQAGGAYQGGGGGQGQYQGGGQGGQLPMPGDVVTTKENRPYGANEPQNVERNVV
jgi:hypothetical protein